MKVAIVSNIDDGIGLKRDYELLRGYLESRGHEVTGFQFDKPPTELPKFDLAIFLEVIPYSYLDLSETCWWFPNLEWIKPDMLALAKQHIQKVFTKTHEAQRVLEPLLGKKVFYTGFLARDQYDPMVRREPNVLHVGGNSWMRGTGPVLDAWRWKRNGEYLNVPLTIVSCALKEKYLPPNVTHYEYVDEAQLRELQNSHFIHLYPSGTEGYGHALHESLSVGAAVITTDGPPMNEINATVKVKTYGKGKYNLADVHHVSALEIRAAVEQVAHTARHAQFLAADLMIKNARQEFLDDNLKFQFAMDRQLAEFTPVVKAASATKTARERQTVAFLGNFKASESTENMIAWALTERLGMDLVKLQENEIGNRSDLAVAEYADYFLWVRTPGWLQIDDEEMLKFLEVLRDKGVPSLSVHLDKFWGIPEREKLIGVHPFWRTDHVFTADGSRAQDFESRGVAHYYMRPAASEVFHHRGRPREDWKCDVAFVGARSYHQEHPWREKLISFLEDTYGERFRLVESGLRGHDLNDFYASAKVVVGDCFGSGHIANYFSDRMVETPMRFGFLLSPAISGLDIPVATFEPENIVDLKDKIDYWLAHDEERQKKRDECAGYVRLFDNWAERLRWILRTVNDARKSDQSVRSKIGSDLPR